MPLAREGLLDLTEWDLTRDGNVNLNGEWEFYWEELLEPADFTQQSNSRSRRLITLPTSWNSYQIEGDELGGSGYATFRLNVILPDAEDVKAISIPAISTAHKLWINGEMVASLGNVSENPEQFSPKYFP